MGAGVIGLTTAITLKNAGYTVQIFAKAFNPNTTSNISAAYFAPLSGLADAALKPLVQVGFQKMAELAQDPSYGVRPVRLHELSQTPDYPAVLSELGGVEALEGRYTAPWDYGFSCDIYQIDTTIYMPRLMQEIEHLNIPISERTVENWDELEAYSVAINCTGLGARELGDPSVYPIRGQIVRVSRPRGFPDIVINAETDEQITYIVPRTQDIVLGGTYQYGSENLEVDPLTANTILARCLELCPQLAEAQVLQHRVGLRPGRVRPRIEPQHLPRLTLIHNYGHGPSGQSWAWGSAARVLQLLESV